MEFGVSLLRYFSKSCSTMITETGINFNMNLVLKIVVLICWLFNQADSQFAYPVDPNPPQATTAFSCFACSGEGCGETRIEGRHEEESCTGARIACWTVNNPVARTYTRMCGLPTYIRQGVFCNRLMEGKEFCFAAETAQGRVRLCAKCCLSDRCNSEPLQNIPDPSLQTCFACDGNNESICNSEMSLSNENSTYVEQCLLPGSDCWTQRTRSGGNDVYVRGCQLRRCGDDTLDEVCTNEGNEIMCSSCCNGKLCNRFSHNGSQAARYSYFLNFLLACICLKQLLL